MKKLKLENEKKIGGKKGEERENRKEMNDGEQGKRRRSPDEKILRVERKNKII